MFVERNIKNFSYDQEKMIDGKSQMILLHSRRAIKCFIEDLEGLNVDIHKDDDILMFDGVKEIMSILNSVDLYFDKIKDSEIAPYHKSFYKTLMQHELLFSVFPYQDLDNQAHLRKLRISPPASACGYKPLDLWRGAQLNSDSIDFAFSSKVLVAAGWKPGCSTDYDAVLLAEKLKAKSLINLSNIEKVYSEDPKKNPNAKALDSLTWQEMLNLLPTEWSPGLNMPFDPIAAKRASELGMSVYIAKGTDIANTMNILEKKDFKGTIIKD